MQVHCVHGTAHEFALLACDKRSPHVWMTAGGQAIAEKMGPRVEVSGELPCPSNTSAPVAARPLPAQVAEL